MSRLSWRRYRIGALFALVLVSPFLVGCLVRTVEKGLKAQEYAEDTPTFTSLPADVCGQIGRSAGLADWIGDTSSDGQAPRSDDRVLCTWPAVLTPSRVQLNIEISWHDRPAVKKARLEFDHLLRKNVCENMLVTTCKRYRQDRKFIPLKRGDRACVYAANPHSVDYVGIMRKANVIVMVDIQTRRSASPAELRRMATASTSPVRAALVAADKTLVVPPQRPSSDDKIFPLPEPPNKCKPEVQ